MLTYQVVSLVLVQISHWGTPHLLKPWMKNYMTIRVFKWLALSFLLAKNPPPACITVNRYFGIKMCAKMTNVFLSGRNVHACLEMEGFWDGEPTFNYPFNCFRFGSEGVAVVRPEDGGGKIFNIIYIYKTLLIKNTCIIVHNAVFQIW